MIGHISGKLIQASPAGQVIVECAGVGYLLHCSLTTLGRLPEIGAEVSLLVHTNVRENAIELFGFAETPEKRMFLLLIQVKGVGPAMASKILSGISTFDLVAAIGRGDTAGLSSIPGIGKKTAERLVVEIRDKLKKHPELYAGDVQPAAETPGKTQIPELAAALTAMGFKPAEAEKAIERLEQEGLEEESFESRVRAALKILTRGKL